MRACLIFNPTARGDKAKRRRLRLSELESVFALRPTSVAGGARELAREAVEEGFQWVIAAGGDGTVNEVVNGMCDAEGGLESAALGVLPLGTVNVFALELGIPLLFEKGVEVLMRGKEWRIDLPWAEYEGKGAGEIRHFVQLAGAGLDARAVHLVNWEMKKWIGPGAYLMAGMQAFVEKRMRIEVRANGECVAGEQVLVGNGRFYGGRIPVFSRAELTDGVLDVCVFPKITWLTLGRYAWSYMAQRIIQPDLEYHLQASSLELAGSREVFFELDGELVGALPVRFGIRPKALRVIVP